MWVLNTPDGAEAPQLRFRILPGSIKTVGRSTGADFIVEAPLVSRIHCRLTAGATELEVIDLESTNGTFVNGERLNGSRQLQAGDVITIGQTQLTYEVTK